MFKWLADRGKKQGTINDSLGVVQSPQDIIDPALLPTHQAPPQAIPSIACELPFQGTIEIGVEVFFNARHSVAFKGSIGPIHNHSFRLRISCAVNGLSQAPGDLIPSAKMKNVAYQVVAPFNNQFLNELAVFASQQPTTELLAVVLYQRFMAHLNNLPIGLVSLTLWESPTLSVTLVPDPSGCQIDESTDP